MESTDPVVVGVKYTPRLENPTTTTVRIEYPTNDTPSTDATKVRVQYTGTGNGPTSLDDVTLTTGNNTGPDVTLDSEDVTSLTANGTTATTTTTTKNKTGLDPELNHVIDSSVPNGKGRTIRVKSISIDTTVNLIDVTYTVTVREGRWWNGCCLRPKIDKQVLKDISLQLRSGQLTAILGNSGSGKTTLLDLISNKVEGKVEGKVYFDQTELTREVFRLVGGYVIQADRLLANLTVRETLDYTAQLKFMGSISRKKIDEKVIGVIEDMGLRHVTNTIIGGMVTKGISGGEKRRVSIAIQLLQDPYILLLDEPTTGLDSFTAHSLVQSLVTLAHTHNKILLMSVHQPRSDIFKLFDQVGLLCKGDMVYFGPREKLVPHFTSVGYPCPTYANPLDHYVDVASVDHRSSQRESHTMRRVQHLKKTYRDSEIFTSMQTSIEAALKSSDNLAHANVMAAKKLPVSVKVKHAFTKTWILLKRLTVNIIRDRSGFVVRICSLLAFSFFIWIFLWELGFDLTSIQDRTGLFFETISGGSMIGLMNAIAMFPPLRDVYYRESGDDLYGSFGMCISYYIHILPFQLLSSFLFAVWVYWGVGLYPEWDRFGIYFSVVAITQYLGELQTMLFLGVFNGVALAQSVSTLVLTASVLYSTGLLRTFDSMMLPLQWLGYASYFKYASEILVANEYHQLNFTCPANATLPCTAYTGDLYLAAMFPDAVDNLAMNFGIMMAFLVGFCILVWLTFFVRGERHLH